MARWRARLSWGAACASIVAVAAGLLHARPAPQQAPSWAGPVDAVFTQWDRPGSPGCALGVYQDGRIAYTRGYGIADLEHNVPITPDSVLGHPGRYCYLVAERPPEEDNPWEQIHVTNGLKAGDSAVSMYPAGTHIQFNFGTGANTLENNLYVAQDVQTSLGQFQAAIQRLLVINPQAAHVFHSAGWDKTRFRDTLLKQCVRPVRDLKRTGGTSVTATWHWTKLVDVNDDNALVPSMIDAHHLQVMVAGGWAPPVSQCAMITSMQRRDGDAQDRLVLGLMRAGTSRRRTMAKTLSVVFRRCAGAHEPDPRAPVRIHLAHPAGAAAADAGTGPGADDA